MLHKGIHLLVLFLLGMNAAYAQDMGPVSRVTYYMAADANGVQQVFQQTLGTREARQVTHAANDVNTFGVAFDGLSIAYVSGEQLWLQPIHTEDAEALAPVTARHFSHTPVYSPDGEYIAYANDGVWLYDLAKRETRQLLNDVQIAPSGENAGEFQIHFPERFVRGTDGKPAKLIVDVGVWEWNTVGVYDLATSDFHILEGQNYITLLPLYGDKVLLYGNTGVSGTPGLALAENLDDLNTYQPILDFGAVTAAPLFAEKAVEIHPGVVRIFGQGISAFPDEVKYFYMDYNVMEDTVGQVHILTLRNESGGLVYMGEPSPDGSLLPVYHDGQYTDWGTVSGSLEILDLASGENTALAGTTGVFNWQPF